MAPVKMRMRHWTTEYSENVIGFSMKNIKHAMVWKNIVKFTTLNKKRKVWGKQIFLTWRKNEFTYDIVCDNEETEYPFKTKIKSLWQVRQLNTQKAYIIILLRDGAQVPYRDRYDYSSIFKYWIVLRGSGGFLHRKKLE